MTNITEKLPEYIELLLKQSSSENHQIRLLWMDSRKISHIFNRPGIIVVLKSGDIKGKKYSYIWAKYDLGDKQDPIERALFQET